MMAMIIVMSMIMGMAAMLVAVQQVRPHDKDKAEHNNDEPDDDVDDDADAVRQACRHKTEGKADGQTTACCADDKGCGEHGHASAAAHTGHEGREHQPGMPAGIYAVHQTKDEACLHGNEKQGLLFHGDSVKFEIQNHLHVLGLKSSKGGLDFH